MLFHLNLMFDVVNVTVVDIKINNIATHATVDEANLFI